MTGEAAKSPGELVPRVLITFVPPNPARCCCTPSIVVVGVVAAMPPSTANAPLGRAVPLAVALCAVGGAELCES